MSVNSETPAAVDEKKQKKLEALARGRVKRLENLAKKKQEQEQKQDKPVISVKQQAESDSDDNEVEDIYFQPPPKDPRKKAEKQEIWRMIRENNQYITDKIVRKKAVGSAPKKPLNPKQQHYKDKINSTPTVSW
jgi:hypothetical protein